MSSIGLAVITATVTPCLPRRLRPCIKSIGNECSSLYLHLAPLPPPHACACAGASVNANNLSSLNAGIDAKWNDIRPKTYPNDDATRDVLFGIYGYASKDTPLLDLRIIISNLTSRPGSWLPPLHRIAGRFTHLYTDASQEDEIQRVSRYVQAYFSLLHSATNEFRPFQLVLEDADALVGDDFDEVERRKKRQCPDYDHVVLGGTFDRMHTGHKLLLTASALAAEKSVTVGVTDGAMNNKKTLSELIEPTSFRVGAVRDFLQEIKPTAEPIVVPIQDPFGPSIVDPRLQAIVVSEETVSGGEAVNKRRGLAGLSTLETVTIPLLQDGDEEEGTLRQSVTKEEKISSSGRRFEVLGTLLAPPQQKVRKDGAYVVGLTGGIASGKTSIARRFEKLGAARIDCDALGHEAYLKGTDCFASVVAHFGPEIVCPTSGEIDRKRLGPIVFAKPEKLDELNTIVWPAIKRLAVEEIVSAAGKGAKVVVMEAAVLLEANWDDIVDEVWVSIVPPDEAIRRVVDRNGLTAEAAKKRLEAQASNGERVAKANVVLSSLWEPEVTQKQCEKAWKLLLGRI